VKTAWKDHFSGHAADYSAYRPGYPQSLIDFLASVAPATETVLDCGCGGGQLSIPLTSRFDRVIATDASPQQIAHAEAHPRVEYRTATAEASGLQDASVDLVTVAQAAHWFDLDAFYAEARRILKPDGVLALITYGIHHVAPDIDRVVGHFYSEIVGPYWPPERGLVEERYRTLTFPFEEIDAPELVIEEQWDLEQVLGYVNTWSAVQKATQALGRSPMPALAEEVALLWGDASQHRTVLWPLTVRCARVG
jgi:SAM-dependent methyltransferase